MLQLGRPALRLRMTFGVMAFVLSLFAGRLMLLQGVDPDCYALAATKENTKPFVLHATRGTIEDRNGVQLAVTEDAVAITADPQQTKPVAQQLAAILAPKLTGTTTAKLVADDDPAQAASRTSRARSARRSGPDPGRDQGRERADRRAEQGQADRGSRPRCWPASTPRKTRSAATRTAPSPRTWSAWSGADGKGQSGLEYGLNDKLSGKDGKAMYEVDAKGNKIPNADHTVRSRSPGLASQLTLDTDLQWFAREADRAGGQAVQGRVRHGGRDGREVRRAAGDGQLPELRPEQASTSRPR